MTQPIHIRKTLVTYLVDELTKAWTEIEETKKLSSLYQAMAQDLSHEKMALEGLLKENKVKPSKIKAALDNVLRNQE